MWELLTASGEQVQRGQDLMRLLDCNAALVTAVVSEAVYNRLQIGSRATFRLRDGDVMTIRFEGFGRPLINPLRDLRGSENLAPITASAMK